MRAVTQTELGGAEVLKLVDRAKPEPGPGELRIRIAAAGLNPVDLAVASGMFPLLGAPPFSIGWDAAGEVDAIGPDVTGFAVGDQVSGLLNFPAEAASFADFARARASDVAPIPAQMSDIEAGALPLAGLTAWQMLTRHGKLGAGERVMIHAGAGGVGHLAVQIAKSLGGEVWATASCDKLAQVKSFGVDQVIDYASADPFPRGMFDLVISHAGGDHADNALKSLKVGGRLISLLPLNEGTAEAARAEGKEAAQRRVEANGRDMADLMALVTAGKLKVMVAETFPLTDLAGAFAALAARPVGKIVLVP